MNNQIKCGSCGIVNWKTSENCLKCGKNLRQSADIYREKLKVEVNATAKRIFLTLLAIAGIAVTASFFIIDKTSKTSLFERQFWRVYAPHEDNIRQAIISRINAGYANHTVIDPGYNGLTVQCRNGSWQTSASGVHDFKCTNSTPGFDSASFKPIVTESFNAELKSYEILSAEISKYSYPKDIPGFENNESFIRYKAIVKVNQNKNHTVTSSVADPKKDFQKTENQVTEVIIALWWIPKKSAWEICNFIND